MKVIKIKDNSSLASEEFREIPNIISSILDKTMSELEEADILYFLIV